MTKLKEIFALSIWEQFVSSKSYKKAIRKKSEISGHPNMYGHADILRLRCVQHNQHQYFFIDFHKICFSDFNIKSETIRYFQINHKNVLWMCFNAADYLKFKANFEVRVSMMYSTAKS